MTRFVALVLLSLWAAGEAAVRPSQLRTNAGECADEDTPFTRGAHTWTFPSGEAATFLSGTKLIAIEYGSNYKVLREKMSKELYVLTQCGTTPPGQGELADVLARHVNYTVKQFTIPLRVVSSSSTVHLAFFKALGLEDRIKYLSPYATGSCWQKALGCGGQLNASASPPQMSEVDAHFMDCGWVDGTYNCNNVHDEAKGVHFSASQDPAPLDSAKHIKFMAAFFNKEELASQLFRATLAAYANASVVASPKPVVAWISFTAASQWSAAQFELSQASYKLEIVARAGGVNVNGTAVKAQMGSKMTMTEDSTGKTYIVKLSAFNGNKDLASAAFFAALDGVDFIIDQTYSSAPRTYTFETFMTTMGLTNNSNLKFLQNKKVLRVDGTIGENNGSDWYESRIAHPEWAVEGLARQIHADTSKQYRYFRNIATGEVPEVLSASSCTAQLPACNASAYPAPISMMADFTTLFV